MESKTESKTEFKLNEDGSVIEVTIVTTVSEKVLTEQEFIDHINYYSSQLNKEQSKYEAFKKLKDALVSSSDSVTTVQMDELKAPETPIINQDVLDQVTKIEE